MSTLPNAYPALGVTAGFKQELDDFKVSETPAFSAAGVGEHLYLRLRKTDLTTQAVVSLLRDAFEVPRIDIGYAGMKDKRGVCDQWFSIRAPQTIPEFLNFDCVQELDRQWHTAKLRRGQIENNRFVIRLRGIELDTALEERLRLIGDQGVPNYFGPQRFGRDQANLTRARDWLLKRRQVQIDAFRKGLYLSVLRSHLFNLVLAERVKLGHWCLSLDGDVADEETGLPTAPLWGRGRSTTLAAAGDIEQRALEGETQMRADLEYAGVNQGRRPLVLMPRELNACQNESGVEVSFALPPGGYATVLLGECVQLADSTRECAA